MININKDSSNVVVLTLTEKCTLLNPNFLFSFSSTSYNQPVINFNSVDTSSYKSRYNQFNIIESGTTYIDLTGSTINLNPGSYDYRVYESSGSTIEISGTTKVILEQGKVWVSGIDTSIDEVYR